ncbi:MAG TPA: TIGR03936 family radical SAM-associated protein [Candidatus Cloacimonas sp.]|nr:TIGR03936 family radical SAM-associated protein [Candidatus Cloacimonas sp.]
MEEYHKALKESQTPDCREQCGFCGACSERIKARTAVPDLRQATQKTAELKPRELILHAAQYKYRVFYQKLGLLRFISHLDWMRMLFRRIAMLELETVFTQGFSPHPKVSLAPPLPVGVEGLEEYFDISFYQAYSPAQILAALSHTKIPDFNLSRCESIAGKASLPSEESLSVLLEPGLSEQLIPLISDFYAKIEFSYTKSTETRSKTYDLKKIISNLEIVDNELLIVKSLESPSLYDVLSTILNIDKQTLYSLSIRRTGFQ